MGTIQKSCIDGLKPTEEMSNTELYNFAVEARMEIEQLREKLATVKAEKDNTTDEVCDNNEKIRELEKLLADANAKADSSGKYHLQFYRQCEILKKTLNALIEKYEISKGDYLTALTEGNSIDIDGLLMFLSK